MENPKKSKQKLEFKIGEKKDFAINFQYKAGICFIYQLELFSVDFFYNSQKKINQIMNYTQKFEVFLKSIKKLEQENLYNDLFNDTINIYSEYPKFDFMVNIFVNIYDNKSVCPRLLEIFKNFNDKIKNSVKDKNFSYINYEKYLINYNDIFEEITKNIENIISSNSYNPVYFYGFILCYLNYYNYEKFSQLFEKLSVDSKSTLLEILIIYNHFFKKK